MDLGPPLDGETPIDDISGLKIKGIKTRSALNNAEAENIRRVVVKYLAAKPSRSAAKFDLNWSIKLHREMFGRVWSWAGVIRKVNLNIGVPWYSCEIELQNLLDDLAAWKTDILDQSVMLHHRAVRIHPFLNGNGRWSRMMANIWLKRHDHPIVRWPEKTMGAESVVRKKYLSAIRAADVGEYEQLAKLHRRYALPGVGRR